MELTFFTDFTQSVGYTHSFMAFDLIDCLCWKWLIMNPRFFNYIQSFTAVSCIICVLHPAKSMFLMWNLISWQIKCISLVQEDFFLYMGMNRLIIWNSCFDALVQHIQKRANSTHCSLVHHVIRTSSLSVEGARQLRRVTCSLTALISNWKKSA